ncbi:AAA family ATPase [Candidatus Bathyarchaeota archaeon]|nr:AAA family ATPase [Candidatus Bathyarchaeota archaeon]
MAEKKARRRSLVIAIGGLHGTGKSTQARRLAASLGLRYVSAGHLFRKLAEEAGVSLEELSKMADEDPEIDLLIDEMTKEEAKRGGVVIDGALSAWMAENADIKILLTSPLEARVERIAARDGLTLEEARRRTLEREEMERNRFKRYYGIDITDTSVYDIVINTQLFDAKSTARILKNIAMEFLDSLKSRKA